MTEDFGVWTRRKVIQTGCLMTGVALTSFSSAQALEVKEVSLVVDPDDVHANKPQVRWATKELEEALRRRGVKVLRCSSLKQANGADISFLIAAASHPVATGVLLHAGMQVPSQPGALGIVHGDVDGRSVVLATGHDANGLMYALLELAEEAEYGADATNGLTSGKSIVEGPANKVRSLTRLFTSDVEDKPWFNDREMWPQYLSMLARHRFNRFNLAFGIGYDFIRHVTDAYFLFTYPFLLRVPGYEVRATNLSDAERDANLAMLKYIAQQTVMHGLEFSVGLWMHGYEWIESPHANHVIEGITKENHGPYCRDAVRMLLTEVPEISGLTFRIHGESGVTEGSYDFWKTVFEGVSSCGRAVSLDMHTKGMDETMENLALATGLHVQMSPKYWGEHLGLPYHQTDIRAIEQPKEDAEKATGLMKLSTGTRSFLRYGYGDLLREDRKWSVVHRIWPGTQRLLLWGDPAAAAEYSRAFSFCGSDGVEIMEMLSFKGRRGSGIAGNRTAYTDQTMVPRWDWQKYEYTTTVWGRMLYNPETDQEVFLRCLRKDFGPSAAKVCASLAHASRILPTVLTAYAPSAGNNTYWPELYTNESYVDSSHPGPYSDSPKPVLFHTASSFDPPMFSRMTESAAELLGGNKSGRYSPLDVAQWLDEHAAAAEKCWTDANVSIAKKEAPEYRRLAVDLSLQIRLGEFFATRFRSGVLFAIYEQTQDSRALAKSLDLYKRSRKTWAELAEITKPVYLSDITVGELPYQRGHWADRLPAMDRDIALVEARLAQAKLVDNPVVINAIQTVLGISRPRFASVTHEPDAVFTPGKPLHLNVTAQGSSSVRLHYRHVNQAERYMVVPMESVGGGTFRASIPEEYTNTEYPLQYFFEVTKASGSVSLFPGLGGRHMQQPYYVVRRKSATRV